MHDEIWIFSRPFIQIYIFLCAFNTIEMIFSCDLLEKQKL